MEEKEIVNIENEKAYRYLMNLNDEGEGNEKESIIYKISSKNSITINQYGDKCVREFPHCESKNMYNLFKGEKIIEKELDFTEENKKFFGDHIVNFDGNNFDDFNKIKISAPENILNAFLNQKVEDKNITIMFNSIRNLPGTKTLCSIDFTKPIEEEKIKQFIDKYGELIQEGGNEIQDIITEIRNEPDKKSLYEEPITQQYCNFYEFFNMQNKYDYYKKFVVIITNQNLYEAYRKLYPHFIIAIQPNVSFQCVGLTRYTGLNISIRANLNRVIFSDDNVINISFPNFNYGKMSYIPTLLKNVQILEDIFKQDTFKVKQLNDELDKDCKSTTTKNTEKTINLNDYGYLGSSNGFGGFNPNAEWVKNSFKQDYFHDYVIDEINLNKTHAVSENVENTSIYIRDFINKPRLISEIPTSDTADLSFVNPHRLKLIIVNVQVVKNKNIIYNPLHTMAEDLYFTKEIFQKDLKTCQLGIGITLPKDNRRPITCISDTAKADTAKADSSKPACPLETNYNLIEQQNVEVIKKIFPHRSDLITYLGGLLFFNKTGVLAYGGAFGPAKLLNVSLSEEYNKKLKEEINKDTEIEQQNKEKCYDKFSTKTALYKSGKDIVDKINYIEPNKYKKIIYADDKYNQSENKRMTNILDYFTKKMSKITDTNTRKKYILNFLKTYIMWYDIISISSLKNLSGSTGMFKYVREYELENIFSFTSFTKFYDDNKEKIKKIYENINSIKEKLNQEVDLCNRKNDILFYIENYTMFPEKIFNLLSLYIIYTKMYQFIESYITIENKINFAQTEKRDKNRMLLLFGNINDTIYINDTVRQKIQEYMNHLIDVVKNSRDINNELINRIYNEISNEYLK